MKEKEIICKMIRTNIIHRRIMENMLDSTGVYQGQHRILMEISENEYHSQKEIAIAMKVSAATMAISLKKLEKSGYISKVMDGEDNRLNKIVITDKGHQAVEDSKKIFDMTDKKTFEGIDENEKEMFGIVLEKLEQNLLMMEREIKNKK